MPDSWIDKEEFDELLGAFSPKKRKTRHHGADHSLKRARAALDGPVESAGVDSSETLPVKDESDVSTDFVETGGKEIVEDEEARLDPIEIASPEVVPADSEAEEFEFAVEISDEIKEGASSIALISDSIAPTDERGESADGDQREVERDMFGESMFSDESIDASNSAYEAQESRAESAPEEADPDPNAFTESSISALEISSSLSARLREEPADESDSPKSEKVESSSNVTRQGSSKIIVKVAAVRKNEPEGLPKFLEEADVSNLGGNESSPEQDAALALTALAEARSLAEVNALIRRPKSAEPVALSLSALREQAQELFEMEGGAVPPTFEKNEGISDSKQGRDEEASLEFSSSAGSSSADSSRDGYAQTEECLEFRAIAEETPEITSPELSEPLPVKVESGNYDDWPDFENSQDLNFLPSGALSERVEYFTNFAYEKLNASDVVVFDLDGYCLSEPQRKDRRAKGASAGSLFNSVARVPYTVGFRGHTATQVLDSDGKWNCLIPGWGEARRIVARFELDHPLEKGAVRAWSKALAEVLESNHDEAS